VADDRQPVQCARAGFGLVAILGPVPLQSHTGGWCQLDAGGEALTGANRYTLTFELDNLPPVTEFWELPIYDKDGYFHDNPIDGSYRMPAVVRVG